MLQRGLEVLDAIRASDSPLSVSDIAGSTGLDRAVVDRLLPPLVDSGYVAMEGSPPKYAAGPRLGPSGVTEGTHDQWDDWSFGEWTGHGFSRDSSSEAQVADEGESRDAVTDDAHAAMMSFAAGASLATIVQRVFTGDVPESFVEIMGDVDVDGLGPDLDDYGMILTRMHEIDPAAAFHLFFTELSERDQDIVRERFAADTETLGSLADRSGLSRERVRQVAKELRQAFEGSLRSHTLMMERVALAREAIGGLVDMRELRRILLRALPMVGRLPVELDEPFFFLLLPDGAFARLAKGAPWFANTDTRERLGEVTERALAEGLALEALYESVPGLRGRRGLPDLLAVMGLKAAAAEVVGRNVSMNEMAVHQLRRAGTPLAFEDLVEVLEAGDRVRSLRNAMLSDDRIVRVDRAVFALEVWGLPEYSTVRDLMRQDIEAAGGQAAVSDIVERLTARYDVKAASIVAYSRGDEFVRVAPGVIRLRADDEPIEDVERPIESLRGCVQVGRRWAFRIEVTASLLRGFSVLLPNGLAPHFGVLAGESVTLRTDRSGVVSVVRRGLQDNMGRLRWVAEELGLVDGDVLLVLLPERAGGRLSFSGVRRIDLEQADAPRRADLLLGQDADLSLDLARRALGMPRGTRPSEVTARLRARGEDALAALVGEVLGEGSVTDVDTSDIARMLGL